MKGIKSLEDSDLLIKGVTQTNEHETKERRRGFLDMLLGKMGANLLGSILAVKGLIRAGNGVHKTGQAFSSCHILWLTLKYKSITRITLNLKVLIHEIMYQKLWRMGLA